MGWNHLAGLSDFQHTRRIVCWKFFYVQIEIERPVDFEGWYCRKGYTAMNMQAVCDHKMRFTSYSIMSGCNNDKLLWQHSPIGINAQNWIPSGYHLVGDSGYKLLPWLMIPYADDDDFTKKRFNQKFQSANINSIHKSKNASKRIKIALAAYNIVPNRQICHTHIGFSHFRSDKAKNQKFQCANINSIHNSKNASKI